MGVEDLRPQAERSPDEKHTEALDYLREQGFSVTFDRPDTIREALAILASEDALPSVPGLGALENTLTELDAPRAAERDPQLYEAMAQWASEKTGHKIEANEVELLGTIYTNLMKDVGPATGAWGAPETGPLPGLTAAMEREFKKLAGEGETPEDSYPYKMAA